MWVWVGVLKLIQRENNVSSSLRGVWVKEVLQQQTYKLSAAFAHTYVFLTDPGVNSSSLSSFFLDFDADSWFLI